MARANSIASIKLMGCEGFPEANPNHPDKNPSKGNKKTAPFSEMTRKGKGQ